MGCNVRHVPLGDLVTMTSGGTPDKKNQEYWNGDIPWISAKTLKGDYVISSNLFITEEGLDSSAAKLAPTGSLLLLTRGSGLFKRIPLALVGREVAYNQDIKCLTSKRTGISNRYIFYVLKALEPSINGMLETTGIGAGKLSTDLLEQLPIPVLDENARTNAVNFFDTLTNKLALNTRINGYLKALASTAYRAFIETLGGNYHEGTMSELLEIRYGKDHKRLTPGNVPVYGSGGLMRKVDSSLYSGESVLIPRKGSLNNVMYVDEAFWTVDTMFYTVPKEPGAAKYCYQFLCNQDLASMNSGSAVPSMTIKILDALPIKVPTNRALETFNDEVAPLYSAVKQFQIENERLSSLRETLLPRLMSGEIDISKIEVPAPPNSHLFDC